MPADDPRLDALLERWEELREAGQPTSVDELCRDCPELTAELQERIKQLLAIEPFVQEAAPADGPPLPAHIGSYQVLGEISRGGMGIVYRCRQQNPLREVAVKVIHPWRVSPKAVVRFFREAQVLGMLHDPGIAQVFEAGTADVGLGPQPFIAMELVPGLPLDRYAEVNRLDARQKLGLVVKVCDAAQHAHDQGVIHRDLKPPNILVEESGEPRIVDFGVARLTSPDVESLTTQHEGLSPIGSLAYMSPEQAAGDPKELDARCDVYALGVVLYELLAGRSPYEHECGTVFERLQAIQQQVPQLLGTVNRAYRGDLETIVAKALEKDKNRRYQSMAELAADIRRCLRGETILARPVGKLEQLRRWCRRNPVIAALAAAFCAAVLAGASMSGFLAHQALETADIAASRQQEVDRQKTLRSQQAIDVRRKEYNAQLVRVQEVSESDPALGLAWLEEAQRCPPAWRGFTWGLLADRCRRERRTIRAHENDVAYVAFFADGQTLATASVSDVVKSWDPTTGLPKAVVSDAWKNCNFMAFARDGTKLAWVRPNDHSISVCNTATGNEQARLRGHTDKIRAVAFSPDGKSLASASNDRTVRLWDVADGRQRAELAGHESRVGCVAYSADGTTLASGAAAGSVKIWNAATGQPQASFKAHRADVIAIVLSPDGHTVASCSADETLVLSDAHSGAPLMTLPTNTHTVLALAFSPDGKTLAYAGHDRAIRLWDIERGNERTALRGQQATVTSLAFSPDGTMLASGGKDHAVKLWDVRPGLAASTLRGHRANVRCVAFSPDGKRLASGGLDHTVRLWDAESGKEQRTLTGHTGRVSDVCFSPDGQIIASGSWDKTIVLWDADSGAKLAQLSGHTLRVESLAFSPDGLTLASAGADSTVRLWDVKGRRERKTIMAHDDLVSCVEFSHHGKWIASASRDRTIRLWDARTGTLLKTLSGHVGRVTHVAFSANDMTMASAGADRTVILWDAAAGERLATLVGHTSSVLSVAFCPDGKTLASSSEDHTVKLWDAKTGQLQATLTDHANWVQSVAFSADGHAMATASNDRTIKLWRDKNDSSHLR